MNGISSASIAQDISTMKPKSMKSFVWNYFLITNNKEQCQCNICQSLVSYRDGSTSSMRQHLRCKHPQEFLSNCAHPYTVPTTVAETSTVRDSNSIRHEAVVDYDNSNAEIKEPRKKVSMKQNRRKHGGKLLLKHKRIAERVRDRQNRESDVICAGRAFMGVLFGADNYRNWLKLKRRSEYEDHQSFVRWLLTLAKSALDNIEENVVSTSSDNGSKSSEDENDNDERTSRDDVGFRINLGSASQWNGNRSNISAGMECSRVEEDGEVPLPQPSSGKSTIKSEQNVHIDETSDYICLDLDAAEHS